MAPTSLSPTDVQHLGDLARLALSDEERSRYASQLSSVVAYVEQLREVSTESVAGQPLLGVTGTANVLAADEPRAEDDLCTTDPLQIVKEAPTWEQRSFVVRAVLGEETGAA